MMGIMLIEVFVKAAILCGILYVVAKHEADYSFSKVAMVVAGIALGTVLINALAGEQLGRWVILCEIAFATVMIVTFCWTTVPKAIVVVVIYALVHTGLAFAGKAAEKGIMAAVNETESLTESRARETEEVFKGAMEMLDNAYGGAPEADTAPRVEDPEDPVAVPPPTPEPWDEARKQLKTSSTMKGPGGNEIAVINGELVEEDYILTAELDGKRFRWRVNAISNGYVDLAPIDVTAAE